MRSQAFASPCSCGIFSLRGARSLAPGGFVGHSSFSMSSPAPARSGTRRDSPAEGWGSVGGDTTATSDAPHIGMRIPGRAALIHNRVAEVWT